MNLKIRISRLESAALGNDAGMIGAVRFWLDREEEGK